MNFGQALEALKAGKRVAREGWNGKGMWLLLLVPGEPIGNEGVGHIVRVATAVQFSGVLGTFRCLPWIGMKTADDGFVPWLASQTDLLAADWVEVVHARRSTRCSPRSGRGLRRASRSR